MIRGGRELFARLGRERNLRWAGWAVVLGVLAFYSIHIAKIGMDWRQSFWVYWAPEHAQDDIDNAMKNGSMVLSEAENIAQTDEGKKSAGELAEEQRLTDLGISPATIARPGPGLFDSPFNPRIFFERWHHLRPIYSQIIRGWVQTYENLYRTTPDQDYDLDYPPMRLLTMTLWTWKVQSEFPGLTGFPHTPQRVFDPNRNQSVLATMDIAQPLLHVNAFCEGVSAICISLLVWLWMERRPKTALLPMQCAPESWKQRWGDPMLLAPVVIFGICALFRSNVTWQWALSSPDNGQASLIDVRVISVSWWVMLLMRFLSAVCLARFLPRPYRAPMCALVAGTIAWLNPASILDSFGWPQWDTWLPPFFLLAAVLVTLDCWIMAGFVLGIGCMFKGQLIFVAPVLWLCPLLAWWPRRFVRILTGTAVGAGLIVWPWLVTNQNALKWIFFAVATAVFFCALSTVRGFLWQQGKEAWGQLSANWARPLGEGVLIGAALFLVAMVWLVVALMMRHGTPLAPLLLAIAIVAMPWALQWRRFGPWILTVFAASLWLAYFYCDGSPSWWTVGFVYGTQKHSVMQLGAQSLSNLSSILHERYQWELHDHVATLNFLHSSFDLDVQGFCGAIYVVCALLCAGAAAMHMRRNDARFLITLVAPWVLFTILLTQMTARYTVLPAVIASSLVGISVEMSLLPFLQTVLACVMLGNQTLGQNTSTAPIAFSITQPTYPDLGWMTVLLAVVFLVCALVPSMRWRRGVEVL
jgi:hypothetical protein